MLPPPPHSSPTLTHLPWYQTSHRSQLIQNSPGLWKGGEARGGGNAGSQERGHRREGTGGEGGHSVHLKHVAGLFAPPLLRRTRAPVHVAAQWARRRVLLLLGGPKVIARAPVVVLLLHGTLRGKTGGKDTGFWGQILKIYKHVWGT